MRIKKMLTLEEKLKLIIDEKYPLAAKYNAEWMYEIRWAVSVCGLLNRCPGLWI